MLPVTTNSSIAGSIPNMMTITVSDKNVVNTQNLGTGQQAILPNALNMRQGAPTVGGLQSVQTVFPSAVIGTPQVVGTRATAPGMALQTFHSIPQVQQDHWVLKTVNQQCQLVRAGPAPTMGTLSTLQPQFQFSTIQTHSGVPTVSTSVAAPVPMTRQMHPPVTQEPLNNTENCRKFLANLLDIFRRDSNSVGRYVHKLIQKLINAQMEPEEFCYTLERLLKTNLQPSIIGLLKKGMPLLRQLLVTKDLVIEGMKPPSPQNAFNSQPALVSVPIAATSTVPKQKPFQAVGNTIAVLQNIPVHSNINIPKVGKTMTQNSKFNCARSGAGPSGLSTVHAPGKSLLRKKENIEPAQLTPQPFVDSEVTDVDDVNDIRSCKNEYLEVNEVVEKRREDSEREMLLRIVDDESKSSNKSKTPELIKLKAKPKKTRRELKKELRRRLTNETALLALGPWKKRPWLDGPGGNDDTSAPSTSQGPVVKRELKRRATNESARHALSPGKNMPLLDGPGAADDTSAPSTSQGPVVKRKLK